MVYDFVCDCGNKKNIENPISDPLPTVICEKCNSKMYQNFKEKLSEHTIIIPENFKATSHIYDNEKYYGKMNVHEKQVY
jgi:hypothetical protein